MAPSAPRRRPSTHAGRCLALASALVLSACGGGNEAEKAAAAAAAPLKPAFEALGLRSASWAKVSLDGASIVLRDVRAEMDGVGQIRLAGITVRGFRETDAGWQADLIQGDALEGAARARQVSIRAPRARRDAGAWAVRDEGRFLDTYEGPLAGVPVALASAGIGPGPRMPGRPESTRMAASGLRLAKGAARAPSPLSDLAWDVSVGYEPQGPGSASVEVERADAEGWSLRGRISLVGGPSLAMDLAGLGPSALADTRAWPGDVRLREADLDMTMARPNAFLGTTAVDPVASSLAAKVAGGGLASWHLRMQPARPVAVRDLPDILRAAGADARLGLSAQVRDVVVPSRTVSDH